MSNKKVLSDEEVAPLENGVDATGEEPTVNQKESPQEAVKILPAVEEPTAKEQVPVSEAQEMQSEDVEQLPKAQVGEQLLSEGSSMPLNKVNYGDSGIVESLGRDLERESNTFNGVPSQLEIFVAPVPEANPYNGQIYELFLDGREFDIEDSALQQSMITVINDLPYPDASNPESGSPEGVIDTLNPIAIYGNYFADTGSNAGPGASSVEVSSLQFDNQTYTPDQEGKIVVNTEDGMLVMYTTDAGLKQDFPDSDLAPGFFFYVQSQNVLHTPGEEMNLAGHNLVITIKNEFGMSDSAPFNVHIVDDVPIAKDETVKLLQDTDAAPGAQALGLPVNVAQGNLLANDDLSVDNPNLVKEIFYQFNGQQHSQLVGDAITVQTDYGSFTIDSEGNYSYQITAELSREHVSEDLISYRVEDADADSSTANLLMRMAPAPIIEIVPADPNTGGENVNVTEGDGSVEYQITVTGVTLEDIIIQVATNDGSAFHDGDTPGRPDYQEMTTTVTIPADENNPSRDFDLPPVQITDDNVFEYNEGSPEDFLTIVTPTQGTVHSDSDLELTTFITDDDPPPQINITSQLVTDENNPSGQVVLTVTMTGSSQDPVTLHYSTNDGSAVSIDNNNGAGTPDYIPVSGTITFPSSFEQTQSTTITVPIVDDFTYEHLVENFTVTLTPDDLNGAVITTGISTVSINDDDPMPYLKVVGGQVNEADGTFQVQVELYGSSQEPISFNYQTVDGSATANASGPGQPDYSGISGTHTFNPAPTSGPNALSQTAIFSIPIIDDQTFEHAIENLTFQITPTSGTIIDVAQSTLSDNISIVDNDPPPVISISDISINEDTGVADLVITRTGATDQDITFQLTTQDGSAIDFGSGPGSNDYDGVNNSYTFSASNNATETIHVPVKINPDNIYELNEQFSVNLTPVTGTGTISNSSDLNATVTIVNDDPPPVITVQDVVVDEDTGVANLVITRTGATSQDISFQLVTQDGSAIDLGSGPGSNDYDGVNNIYTFNASGNGTETIIVPITINPDSIYEPNEQFGVDLIPVAGTGTISSSSDLNATVTINNDDAPPVITVQDVVVDEDTGVANLVITRTGATSQDISFQLVTQDGSAIDLGSGPGSNDYDGVNNIYTFNASGNGTETIIVPITINPDSIYESNEQFGVDLIPVAGTGTISSSSDLNATVTINNDDAPPVITVQDVIVNEDTGVANLVITRTGATSQDISFQLVTQDGTAVDLGSGPGSNDYDGVNNIYTFNASGNGTETIIVPITINPDAIYESNEQFGVQLIPVAGTGTISSSSDLNATVTINNDDAPPVITITDVVVNEDTGKANLVITRTGATSENVTFQLVTQDGSAISVPGVGGNDYNPINNTYTFNASDNPTETIIVPVDINPDNIYEPTEQFGVQLIPVTGTIDGGSDLNATVTINNDDAAPHISIQDVSVQEDSGMATVTITRTGATSQNISLQLTTQDGTAQSGGSGPGNNDYQSVNTNFTIPASNNATETITVNIPINPDNVAENNETFTVNLTPLAGDIRADSDLSAVVTINDDDLAPRISIQDVSVQEDSGMATVTITRTGATSQNISLQLTTQDGTAQSGGSGPGSNDYQPLNFNVMIPASNNATETITVNIPINPDNVAENDETFTVNLTPIAGTIRPNSDLSATVTIINDDEPDLAGNQDIYMIDGSSSGEVRVLKVASLVDGVAQLELLTSIPSDISGVHGDVNPDGTRLYLVGNSFGYVDLTSPTYEYHQLPDFTYNGVTFTNEVPQGAFALDGTLYIGDASTNQYFKVNLNTGDLTLVGQVTNFGIAGGDITITDQGDFWSVNAGNQQGGLFKIEGGIPDGGDVVGIPTSYPANDKPSGLANIDDGTLLVLNRGDNTIVHVAANGQILDTYELQLNGQVLQHNSGDLASRTINVLPGISTSTLSVDDVLPEQEVLPSSSSAASAPSTEEQTEPLAVIQPPILPEDNTPPVSMG